MVEGVSGVGVFKVGASTVGLPVWAYLEYRTCSVHVSAVGVSKVGVSIVGMTREEGIICILHNPL